MVFFKENFTLVLPFMITDITLGKVQSLQSEKCILICYITSVRLIAYVIAQDVYEK